MQFDRRRFLAGLAATPTLAAVPSWAQPHRDTTLRWMPLDESNVRLGGANYRGLVGRRDYNRETVDGPPRGAGFGQNPYRGRAPEYLHSEDYGLVVVALMSWRTVQRRWVDTTGGCYVELVDIGDQGRRSPVRIRMTSLDRDGRRRLVRIAPGHGFTVDARGWMVIPGGAQSVWNRGLTTVRYEGFMREARLEVRTGPGAIPTGRDPGARGNGDGFLIAVAGRADCIPEETNEMVVTRTRAG